MIRISKLKSSIASARRAITFVCKSLSLFLVIGGVSLFACTVLAKDVEPGPEADGEWTCGRMDEKEWVELGMLELRGRTYRTYKKDTPAEKRDQFRPFTTDGKGRITFSNSFSFISYEGRISDCTYTLIGDKPAYLFLHYSDRHYPHMMSCHKTTPPGK